MALLKSKPKRKRGKMIAWLILVLVLASAGALVFSTDYLSTFGADPSGARLERIKKSPNFNGQTFINPIPTSTGLKSGTHMDTLKRWVFGREKTRPDGPYPVAALDKKSFNPGAKDGLRVTWLGHSTLLIEIDGYRVLTDPVWGQRCSPSSLAGPARFHPAPIALADLPSLDAVIISHDHHDHLEKATVTALAKTGTRFVMPLGVGAHLEKWGIPNQQIVELDWWESAKIGDGGLTLTSLPARHFSGRKPWGANRTQWASFAVSGPGHNVYFSGDTGFFPGFKEIGQKLGPFDMTMIKIGAFDRSWPDIHLNPEQAIQAHQDLDGRIFLPIHWGTFNLALHAWNDPIRRAVKAAGEAGIILAAPIPGGRVDTDHPVPVEAWWEN